MAEEDVMSAIKEAVGATAQDLGVAIKEDGSIEDAPVGSPDSGRARGADGKFAAKPAAEAPVEEPEPTGEPQVEEPAGRPAAPVAEKATKADDEEQFRATAEELDVINNSPELKKVYNGFVRQHNKKSQEFAELRKEAEMAMAAVKEVRANPEKAIRALADAAGFEIVKKGETPAAPAAPKVPDKTTLEKVHAKLTATAGKDAADILAPVMVEVFEDLMDPRMAPVTQTLEEAKAERAQLKLRNEINEFGAKVVEEGGVWDEDIQAEVSKEIPFVLPGKDVTLHDYLDRVLSLVMARREKENRKADRVETVTRQATRIKTAAATAEPVKSVKTTPAPQPTIKPGMDAKEATLLAVAQAKQELASR